MDESLPLRLPRILEQRPAGADRGLQILAAEARERGGAERDRAGDAPHPAASSGAFGSSGVGAGARLA